MSSNTLKYFQINAYDFDVTYSKPNEKGEVKGAKVQIPYIGTVVVPAKNVWVPENQETKKFGGKGSYKGHNEYKNCVIKFRTGNMADGKPFSYPVLTKTANGKVNRFNMSGDELQAKIEKITQGYTDKSGKEIKHNYAMVIQEYDLDQKKVVFERSLWKESQAADKNELKEAVANIPSEKDLLKFAKAEEEWMKDLEEHVNDLENSIEENKSLVKGQ